MSTRRKFLYVTFLSAISLFLLPFTSFALISDTYLKDMDPTQEIIPSITQSLQDNHIKTIAFWDFEGEELSRPEDLEDFSLNLMYGFLDTGLLTIIDRQRLDALLHEQEFSASGLVDPQNMKNFGEQYGVDAFIYGEVVQEFNNPYLTLKVIETETSALLWMKRLPIRDGQKPSLTEKLLFQGINSFLSDLKENPASWQGIKSITVWRASDLSSNADKLGFINVLATQIVDSGLFYYVDRSNVERLLKEQKLSTEGYVSPEQTKEMGKLYDIDAYLYIRIYELSDKNYLFSIRLTDVETSVVRYVKMFLISEVSTPQVIAYEKWQNPVSSLVASLDTTTLDKVQRVGLAPLTGMEKTPVEANLLQDVLMENLQRLGRFSLIDRQNIDDFLKEQRFSAEGLVDPRKAKEMGKFYGVDTFLFLESFYINPPAALIVAKAVSTEKATLLWGGLLTKELPVDKSREYNQYQEIAQEVAKAIGKSANLAQRVRTLGLLEIVNDTGLNLNLEYIREFLSILLTRTGRHTIVDRSNLDLLLSEFAKGEKGLVDPQKAAETGRMLGIDGFMPLRLSFDLAKREMNIFAQITAVETGALVYGSKLRVSWPITLTIIPREAEFVPGKTQKFYVEIKDLCGNDFRESKPSAEWSISNGLAKVQKKDELGREILLQAKKTGEGWLEVKWLDVYAKAKIEVNPVKLGDMVLIPEGEFLMGSDHGHIDETSVHKVYLDAYYIDKYEVTNKQYREFVKATGHRAPKNWGEDNHPVAYVSWEDAVAYATWAGKRLPTEAEWEKAARGGLVGKEYPWGDSIDSSKANYAENIGDTIPVGTYPPNNYGLYDMAGNVWEWVSDWYDKNYFANSPSKNPQGPNNGSHRVFRGGGWMSHAVNLRCDARGYGPPASGDNNDFGFRCVKSP